MRYLFGSLWHYTEFFTDSHFTKGYTRVKRLATEDKRPSTIVFIHTKRNDSIFVRKFSNVFFFVIEARITRILAYAISQDEVPLYSIVEFMQQSKVVRGSL
jgi:hypothetical protein